MGVSGKDDTGPAGAFAGFVGPGAEGAAVGPGDRADVLGAEGAEGFGDEEEGGVFRRVTESEGTPP